MGWSTLGPTNRPSSGHSRSRPFGQLPALLSALVLLLCGSLSPGPAVAATGAAFQSGGDVVTRGATQGTPRHLAQALIARADANWIAAQQLRSGARHLHGLHDPSTDLAAPWDGLGAVPVQLTVGKGTVGSAPSVNGTTLLSAPRGYHGCGEDEGGGTSSLADCAALLFTPQAEVILDVNVGLALKDLPEDAVTVEGDGELLEVYKPGKLPYAQRFQLLIGLPFDGATVRVSIAKHALDAALQDADVEQGMGGTDVRSASSAASNALLLRRDSSAPAPVVSTSGTVTDASGGMQVTFAVDYGERVFPIDPLQLFTLRGSPRTDIVYEVALGRLWVTAFLPPGGNASALSLELRAGAAHDVAGNPSEALALVLADLGGGVSGYGADGGPPGSDYRLAGAGTSGVGVALAAGAGTLLAGFATAALMAGGAESGRSAASLGTGALGLLGLAQGLYFAGRLSSPGLPVEFRAATDVLAWSALSAELPWEAPAGLDAGVGFPFPPVVYKSPAVQEEERDDSVTAVDAFSPGAPRLTPGADGGTGPATEAFQDGYSSFNGTQIEKPISDGASVITPLMTESSPGNSAGVADIDGADQLSDGAVSPPAVPDAPDSGEGGAPPPPAAPAIPEAEADAAMVPGEYEFDAAMVPGEYEFDASAELEQEADGQVDHANPGGMREGIALESSGVLPSPTLMTLQSVTESPATTQPGMDNSGGPISYSAPSPVAIPGRRLSEPAPAPQLDAAALSRIREALQAQQLGDDPDSAQRVAALLDQIDRLEHVAGEQEPPGISLEMRGELARRQLLGSVGGFEGEDARGQGEDGQQQGGADAPAPAPLASVPASAAAPNAAPAAAPAAAPGLAQAWGPGVGAIEEEGQGEEEEEEAFDLVEYVDRTAAQFGPGELSEVDGPRTGLYVVTSMGADIDGVVDAEEAAARIIKIQAMQYHDASTPLRRVLFWGSVVAAAIVVAHAALLAGAALARARIPGVLHAPALQIGTAAALMPPIAFGAAVLLPSGGGDSALGFVVLLLGPVLGLGAAASAIYFWLEGRPRNRRALYLTLPDGRGVWMRQHHGDPWFLSRYGLLFAGARGPPLALRGGTFALLDKASPSGWVDHPRIAKAERAPLLHLGLLGDLHTHSLRLGAVVAALAKTAGAGVAVGALRGNATAQAIALLCVCALHWLYGLLLRPLNRKRDNTAAALAGGAEVTVASSALAAAAGHGGAVAGTVMLTAAFAGLGAYMIWLALAAGPLLWRRASTATGRRGAGDRFAEVVAAAMARDRHLLARKFADRWMAHSLGYGLHGRPVLAAELSAPRSLAAALLPWGWTPACRERIHPNSARATHATALMLQHSSARSGRGGGQPPQPPTQQAAAQSWRGPQRGPHLARQQSTEVPCGHDADGSEAVGSVPSPALLSSCGSMGSSGCTDSRSDTLLSSDASERTLRRLGLTGSGSAGPNALRPHVGAAAPLRGSSLPPLPSASTKVLMRQASAPQTRSPPACTSLKALVAGASERTSRDRKRASESDYGATANAAGRHTGCAGAAAAATQRAQTSGADVGGSGSGSRDDLEVGLGSGCMPFGDATSRSPKSGPP